MSQILLFLKTYIGKINKSWPLLSPVNIKGMNYRGLYVLNTKYKPSKLSLFSIIHPFGKKLNFSKKYDPFKKNHINIRKFLLI